MPTKTSTKNAKKKTAPKKATTPVVEDDSPALSDEEQATLTGENLPATQSHNPTEVMFQSDSDISGATDDQSIKLPRLNLVQKVGPLADKFNKGEFVLNGEEVLIDGTKTPLEVTAVKAHYFYEEWLKYGDDRMPERAKDLAEVRARGGEVDWIDNVQPSWRKVAEVLFCVKAPEGLEDTPSFPFSLDIEEEDAGSYTFAMFKLKGSSMTSAGNELITATRFYYRGDLKQGSFNMTAELTKFRSGNSAYVCTLRKNKVHSAAFLDWLKEFQP
jgi:hypothetical protein